MYNGKSAPLNIIGVTLVRIYKVYVIEPKRGTLNISK
jgi:hypothetical protein